MTLTTLVCGARASAREAAIAAAIDTSIPTALILEGLPDGTSSIESVIERTTEFNNLQIARIAPGCVCCTGNLTLRVTLNRMLRRAPGRLFISLATAGHVAQIRQFLQQPPYDKLLLLTEDLHA